MNYLQRRIHNNTQMGTIITHDELRKEMNEKELLKMPRYAGGHDDQMQGLIKDAKVIGHWNEGDYQGSVATCIKVISGEFIIYNDYYGSCSGCDSWEDANDEEVIKMCNDLIYTSKIFNTLKEVKIFLSQERFNSYSWEGCSKHLLEKISKTEEQLEYYQKQYKVLNKKNYKRIIYS